MADSSTATATVPFPPRGAELRVVGDHVRVLQASGAFEVFEVRGAEDTGPPPHAHPWSESYFVLAGLVEVTDDAGTRTIAAGGFTETPAGMVHSFRFVSPDCRMLVMTSGDRASRFFADADAHVPPGPPTPETLPRLVEVARRNGLSSPLF